MNSNFDEEQWVVDIRQSLNELYPEENETEASVHIFTVPPALLAIDPFSFIPNQVSIGPYHFSRPELNDMEVHKLAAAKRNQRELKNLKLQNFVENLIDMEPRIRGSYHRFLNFNSETLAWMMAVDASFLFEFLQVCEVSQGNKTTNMSSRRLSHLVNLAQNITNSMILRDIVKLENQIPLFVLRKLMELQFSSSEKADEMMLLMLTGFCKELSPFKMVGEDLPRIQVKTFFHLLEVLYRFVVPQMDGDSEVKDEEQMIEMDEKNDPIGGILDDKEFINTVWENRQESFFKKIKFPNRIKKIVDLPALFLSKLPILEDILPKILNSLNKENENNEQEVTKHFRGGIISKPPKLEEIEIPSVTHLIKSGIRFKPTNKGIETISFDIKTTTLYLPTISLDMNSPEVLRNLVAYEACTVSGPLVLTRYTELMNGIIDTEKDVKILREKGIIINRLKSDEDVKNICNGMPKSIRFTKVLCIDKVIEDVNKYHNSKWRVIFGRYMKKYVFESWRLLTFFGATLMILFMGLQTFCSVYICDRFQFIEQLN